MFSEDDLLPISALQHFAYCPRQAALIHIERAWRESRETVEGSHLHDTVDSGLRESRRTIRVLRSVPLISFVHGIAGRADVVELLEAAAGSANVAAIDSRFWHVRPVEYKRGRPKKYREDEIQLCAQVLCLEEMFSLAIAEGDLFYGATRRRTTVCVDDELRSLTRSLIARMHEMFASQRTPAAEPGPKCRRCSLREICRPFAAERSASRYVRALFLSAGGETV